MLSSAQRWTLAAGGVLTESNHAPFDAIGMRGDRKTSQTLLAEGWGVTDRKSLLERLVWLRDGGHRDGFLAEVVKVADMLDSDGEDDDTGLSAHGQFIANNLPLLMRVKFVAWDLSRLINVARWGFDSGYISEDEAWSWMGGAALVMRKQLTSWKEAGEDFMLGYRYWSLDKGGTAPSVLAAHERLLGAGGPWSSIPWNIDPEELASLRSAKSAQSKSAVSLSARNPDACALLDKEAGWPLVRSCFSGEQEALRFVALYFAERYPPPAAGHPPGVFRVTWKKAGRTRNLALVSRLINLAMRRLDISELSFDTHHALDRAAHPGIKRRLKLMMALRIGSLFSFIVGGLGIAGVLGAYVELTKAEFIEAHVIQAFIINPLIALAALCLAGLAAAFLRGRLQSGLPFGPVKQYGFAPCKIVEIHRPSLLPKTPQTL